MYVLYFNSPHPKLSNSDSRCRLIVGFSESPFLEANPQAAQVNRAISPTYEEQEHIISCRGSAVNADDPLGAFLIPHVLDRVVDDGCTHGGV